MPIALLVQPHTSNFLKALHECPRKMGIKFLKISIHVHIPYHPVGMGGEYSPKFLLGVCGSFHENLTHFQTKISEVPNFKPDLKIDINFTSNNSGMYMKG